MIDIHSHILPGIDDGARHMDDTLRMLKLAAESGTRAMIATPHCNLPGLFDNFFNEEYVHLIKQVRRAAKEAKIPVKIYPGMEAFSTWDLPEKIASQQVMPLNQSHYLLMEFDFGEEPDFANRVLERVAALGVKPVVAHVERYEFVQDRPQIIYEWREKGYRIQVNKGSVEGRFGESAEYTAHSLLDHRLVSVIASDAHRPDRRTPYMKDAYELVASRYTEKYANLLFMKNPEKICQDQGTLRMAMRPYV